jgi:hypothetical protein
MIIGNHFADLSSKVHELLAKSLPIEINRYKFIENNRNTRPADEFSGIKEALLYSKEPLSKFAKDKVVDHKECGQNSFNSPV